MSDPDPRIADLEAAFAAPAARMGAEFEMIAVDKKAGMSLLELAQLVDRAAQVLTPEARVIPTMGWRGQLLSVVIRGPQRPQE